MSQTARVNCEGHTERFCLINRSSGKQKTDSDSVACTHIWVQDPVREAGPSDARTLQRVTCIKAVRGYRTLE